MITGDHPIHTTKGYKVIAADSAKIYAKKAGFAPDPLQIGDKLLTLDGEIPVNAISKKIYSEAVPTYNIKLENNASFYANGIELKGFDEMQIHYK